MEKLTRQEKAIARRLGVSAADVYYDGCNSFGKVYALYNDYYRTFTTVNGYYSKAEIYRILLRKLIEQIGILAA